MSSQGHGCSWAPLGALGLLAFLGGPRRSWGALGLFFGSSWALLSAPGRSWVLFGVLECSLVFGRSWAFLGAAWSF